MRSCCRGGMTLAVALALVWGAAGQTGALSVRAASWAELCRSADAVIAATVKSLICEKNDEPNSHGVQTRMVLENAEQLAGKVQLEKFDVLLPGGSLDGRRVDVPGAPKFTPGEKVVLFVRKLDGGELALLGHGLGVLRRSADGGRVTPDIPVANGPARSGEDFQTLLNHLHNPDAVRASSAVFAPAAADGAAPAPRGGALAAVLALLAGVAGWMLLRRQRRSAAKTAAVAVVLAAGGVIAGGLAQRSPARAESAGSRAYVLTGSKWDLYSDQIGRVQAGNVLWLQGQGTPNIADETAFAVIEQQFQKWTSLPASAISFRKAGVTLESGTALDQRNVVSFLQKVPRKSFDAFTLAITFTISSSGVNLDSDIAFNNQDQQWTASGGEASLDVVALHEIGHVLGLDHSPDPADVMYPMAGGLIALSPGDIAGAVALYPVDAAAKPVAIASGSPAIGAAPLTVVFTGNAVSPSGNALSYSWDFGDGSALSAEVSPVHTYTAAGVYNAIVTVSDVNGSATASVTVQAGSGGEAMTVKKFGYTVNLAAPMNSRGGKDRLGLQLENVSLASGDTVVLAVNGVILDSGTGVILDSRSSFKGALLGGGMLALKHNDRQRTLSVSASGASFGIQLDPRGTDLTQTSGSADLHVLLLAKHAGGAATGQSADAAYAYTVKTGKTQSGLVAKSIQGK